ncbi:MAG: hypothetical protein AB8G15_03110 [Saprospiraceae bacterium]
MIRKEKPKKKQQSRRNDSDDFVKKQKRNKTLRDKYRNPSFWLTED